MFNSGRVHYGGRGEHGRDELRRGWQRCIAGLLVGGILYKLLIEKTLVVASVVTLIPTLVSLSARLGPGSSSRSIPYCALRDSASSMTGVPLIKGVSHLPGSS